MRNGARRRSVSVATVSNRFDMGLGSAASVERVARFDANLARADQREMRTERGIAPREHAPFIEDVAAEELGAPDRRAGTPAADSSYRMR